MTESRVQPLAPLSGASPEASIGETLKRNREAQGLSISEVANSLKLNPRQIEALESGRFDRLPGVAFTRGFLRNYARLLKIDAAPMLVGLQDPVKAEAVELAPASNAHGNMPPVRSGRFQRSVIPGILAALALFGLVVAGWYYDTLRKKPTEQLAVEQPQNETAAPSAPNPAETPAAAGAEQAKPLEGVPVSVSPTTVQEQPAGPAANPPTATPASAAPAATPAPPADGMDRLVFTFDQDAWVEIKDKNGKVAFSKLGKAGAREEVQVAPPMSVVVGNARGVKLERNGTAVDFGLTAKATVARLKLQ